MTILATKWIRKIAKLQGQPPSVQRRQGQFLGLQWRKANSNKMQVLQNCFLSLQNCFLIRKSIIYMFLKKNGCKIRENIDAYLIVIKDVKANSLESASKKKNKHKNSSNADYN